MMSEMVVVGGIGGPGGFVDWILTFVALGWLLSS